MATPNLVLEITPNDEIIHVARGRQSKIARLDTANKTIYWKDTEICDTFHESVDSFLAGMKIQITTVLMEGQKPDVLDKKAPPEPPMHKMQGDLTPAFLDWEMKWKPIAFQNRMGVQLRKLMPGEEAPKDPRDLWVRKDVIRTDVRPIEETKGGEYLSTRFKMKDQIIARRRSHLTFEPKEIYRGDSAAEQAEPFEDRYTPANLERMEKRGIDNGGCEIVWKRHAAASAGSNF